jgi:transposase
MLKDSETSRIQADAPTGPTHRNSKRNRSLRASNLASIAALAGQHGMNANVLHRWLKEHQRNGCHASAARSAPGLASPSPAFIPLALPAPTPVSREQEIKVELRKGALSMVVTWPASAAAEFASWTAAILK